MRSYLIHFAQIHSEFRLPELESVAKCFGFTVSLPEKEEERDPNRPFMIVGLEKEEHARQLAKRCVLIRNVYEYWASGDTYEELHEENKANPSQWKPYAWSVHRMTVSSTGHKMPVSRVKGVIDSFEYMGLLGKIDMENPDEVFAILEEYPEKPPGIVIRGWNDGKFRQVYLGRLIEEGSARSLIIEFDIKKRKYFGNTTMDAEMSLIMANQALAAPGKFIYDPFAGTGSLLYTSARFGAFVFGSDIDGRQLRGKEDVPGVLRAAEQYGVLDKIIDCAVFDITRHPFRCGELFDAIITDPPYGVRAGAKRLGRKEGLPMREEPLILEDGTPSSNAHSYRPPTRPYELAELVADLISLSRALLRPGGRLVFFLPTVTEDYQEVDIPTCEGMRLVANSLQLFGGGVWGRRLITMEKVDTEEGSLPDFRNPSERGQNTVGEGEGHVPAHRGFRDKYFAGFRQTDEDVPQVSGASD